MPSAINPGPLRRAFGREKWAVPEPFGSGWVMVTKERGSSVIVSVARFEDDQEWVHASLSHRDRLPTYEDLVTLHRAVWGEDGYAIQIFAPPRDHVNIHQFALHLWGRLDGSRVWPDFGRYGTI